MQISTPRDADLAARDLARPRALGGSPHRRRSHRSAEALYSTVEPLVVGAGTALLLTIVGEYSAVTAVVLTSVRKVRPTVVHHHPKPARSWSPAHWQVATRRRQVFTLCASFVLFPKHVGVGHFVGGGLVLGSALAKRMTKAAPAARVAQPNPEKGGHDEPGAKPLLQV